MAKTRLGPGGFPIAGGETVPDKEAAAVPGQQLYPYDQIESARFGAFRFGFARFGFAPRDVVMDESDAFYAYRVETDENESDWLDLEDSEWTLVRSVNGE